MFLLNYYSLSRIFNVSDIFQFHSKFGITDVDYSITSPFCELVFGFQQRILLSFAQLIRRSGSCGHQSSERMPLKDEFAILDADNKFSCTNKLEVEFLYHLLEITND